MISDDDYDDGVMFIVVINSITEEEILNHNIFYIFKQYR